VAPRLSLIVIARDEETDLPVCLQSVQGTADEAVVVVDGRTTDRTAEAARGLGARVLERAFDDFASQKQAALEAALGVWTLSLDADERLSPELAEEIRALLSGPGPSMSGYRLLFEVEFMGRTLRRGGVGRERHLRLFRRSAGRFSGGSLHEGVEVPGPVGDLLHPVRHRPYRDLREYLEKQNLYTTLAARRAREAGRTLKPWHHAVLPLEFVKRYILRLGFLDGGPGLVWSALSAYYAWLKYVKRSDPPGEGP